MRTQSIRFVSCWLLVVLWGCERFGELNSGAAVAAAEAAGLGSQLKDPPDPAASTVNVPERVRENLGIRFGAVQPRSVDGAVWILGAFEWAPGAHRDYRIPLPGHVELIAEPLARVAAGELLYRFESPEWPDLLHEIVESEQAIALAEASEVVAAATLEEARVQLGIVRSRAEGLADVDMRSAELESEAALIQASLGRLEAQQALEQAKVANGQRMREHALHRASAATRISEEELARVDQGQELPRYAQLEALEVHALEAGVVEAWAISDGEFALSGQRILELVDPARVRLRAIGLQSDLALFERVVQRGGARLVRSKESGEEPGVPCDLRLGLEGDPQRRTMDLLATPEEPAAWMRPGVTAWLLVPGPSRERRLAVPTSAIVRDGLESAVFLRKREAPSQAVRTSVRLGASDGRWVEILEGLELGDEVVVQGALELNLEVELGGGAAGSAPRGGHVHADGTVHSDDH